LATDGLPGSGFAGHPGGRQGARLTRFGCAAFAGAWLALAAFGAVPAAWGADPQTYKVRLEGSIDKNIETTLSASSDLVTLRKSAPVSPVGLILRARGDTVRLKTVLESYGYYDSAVTATIDGEALTSADLADKLTAIPAGKDASVVVSFIPGPQYHLGKITIEGDLPDSMRGKLNLHTGQPVNAAAVQAAAAQLLAVLQDSGYAFAKVDIDEAELLPDSHELDVPVHVQIGAIARFGAISVTGLQRTRLPAVLSRLQMHAGEQYSAQALDRARRNLLAMGVFGSVDVKTATAVDANGAVPVTFRVTERKRHDVVLAAAYSSDLGGSGGVTWTDHNFFGSAEELVLAASIINLNGSATNGIGYDTNAKFIVPEFLHPAQTLQVSLDAIKQSLVAYDQQAETAGLTLTRKLSSIWTLSLGTTTTQETINQPQEAYNFPDRCPLVEAVPPDPSGKPVPPKHCDFYYTLFAFPMSLSLDTTGLTSPLLDPTHGMRAALTITPTLSLGPPDATFVITQIRASAYLDLHSLFGTAPGRTVVAVRGLSAYAQGVSVIYDLPPDQRFYAGGSGTIRGFRFQSVGLKFPDTNHTPVGGVAVDAASLELRQRVGPHWGFAVFTDGGRVGQSASPFGGGYQFGVGAGARYYTPIGAIRLDLAFPVQRSSTDDRLEVYIGLGQAF
jgi:translocation and assembly module TamA